MGYSSNPNQYFITIDRKDNYGKNGFFLVNKDLDKTLADINNLTAIRLYFYYLKNAKGFSFWDGARRACGELGIAESTFRKARNILIEKGYLVDEGNHHLVFHEDVASPPPDEIVAKSKKVENATNVAPEIKVDFATNVADNMSATIVANKNDDKLFEEVATNVASIQNATIVAQKEKVDNATIVAQKVNDILANCPYEF